MTWHTVLKDGYCVTSLKSAQKRVSRSTPSKFRAVPRNVVIVPIPCCWPPGDIFHMLLSRYRCRRWQMMSVFYVTKISVTSAVAAVSLWRHVILLTRTSQQAGAPSVFQRTSLLTEWRMGGRPSTESPTMKNKNINWQVVLLICNKFSTFLTHNKWQLELSEHKQTFSMLSTTCES